LSFKVATWNINSIKVRLDRVVDWLQRERPQVLCLQETKVVDEAFPHDAIEEAGYHAVVHGQKAYNGVALITDVPASDVERGMTDDGPDEPARLIAGTVHGVRVLSAYFTNGKTVGSEAYQIKLEWMRRLLAQVDRSCASSDPVVLAGDFNVAPTDADVSFPERWGGSVLCHQDVRDALARFREWGFIDVVDEQVDGDLPLTWWDYQRLAFPKNDGLRIDHVYATPTLARRATGAWVDREARKKHQFESKPSDHAPVVAEFDL